MLRFIMFAGIGLVMALGPNAVDAEEFLVDHTPVTEAKPNESLAITVTIAPSDQVAYVVVRARNQDKKRFKSVYADKVGDHEFRAEIPSAMAVEPGIEYFIMVIDNQGTPQSVFASAVQPQGCQILNVVDLVEKEIIKAELLPGESLETEEEAEPQISSLFGEDLAMEFELMAAEDYVVSAAKREQKIEQSPSAITVITAKEIAASGLTNLPEILTLAPGLHNIQISATDQNLGIRGFAREVSNRILVLIDGRSAYTDFFGTVLWDAFPIAIEEIEKIEIIRGPGSTLYGANAFTGVINIKTKEAKTSGVSARTVQGEYALDHTTVRGTLAGEEGKSGLAITVNGEGRNTWANKTASLTEDRFEYANLRIHDGASEISHYDTEDPRDKRSWLANTRGYMKFGEESRVDIQAGIGESATILNTQAGQFSLDLNHWFLHGKAELGKNFSIQAFHTRTNFDLFNTVGFIGVFPDEDGTDGLLAEVMSSNIGNEEAALDAFRFDPFAVQSAVSDIELQGSFDLGDTDHLIVGANVRLAETYIAHAFDHKGEEIDGGEDFEIFGAYLQNEWYPNDAFTLNLGLRVDSHPITDVLLSPRAAATWSVSEVHTLRLSVGQAFRNPSFFESEMNIELIKQIPNVTLFRDGFSLQGNDELEAETVTSFELGYVGTWSEDFRINLDLYFNQIDNFITLFGPSTVAQLSNPKDELQRFGFRNSGKAESMGAEISAVWDMNEWFRLKGNYSYWAAVSREDVPFTLADEKDESLEDWPAHMLNLMANLHTDSFQATLWIRMIGQTQWRNFLTGYGQTSFLADLTDDQAIQRNAENRVKLDPVRLVNFMIAFTPGENFEIGLAAYNLTNERKLLAPQIMIQPVTTQTGAGTEDAYSPNEMFGEKLGRLGMIFVGVKF